MALSLPNTSLIVTIDLGDSSSIHPLNKQEVGRRLFLNACKNVYGEDIMISGPAYRSMYITGNKCTLCFTDTGDGLVAKEGNVLKGFMIAGTDKKFYEAQAVISGDKVLVWSDLVSNPVAVRYAWANWPRCNLYNKQGNQSFLPASPFRTDNWPGITYDRK
jgi:sialate O-acetylesterase